MQIFKKTMGRVLVTALVAGAVAAALGGVSLARAGSGDVTLTLTEVQTRATFVNVTHTQQGGPGDQVMILSALKNANGTRIGYSSVVCEIVLGGKLHCTGIYHLPGGTLVGTAVAPLSETSTAPVHIALTGGTGRYDQASGQAVLTPQSETVNHTVIDLD
jgi:hypothetical protein